MDSDNSVTSGSTATLTSARLKTPRAAAIAGILFAVLLITSLSIVRSSIPIDPLETGAWLETSSKRVAFALSLIPFAGIAFMWFIGVLRDRLGRQEDQLFATVFLGSGLMFLGMLFVASGAAGALIWAHSAQSGALPDSSAFAFGRAFTFEIMNTYTVKMAGLFMMITSTLSIRTRMTARWIALLGFACAVFLLLGSGYFDWALFVFPCWVLMVSGYILFDNLSGLSPTPSNGG